MQCLQDMKTELTRIFSDPETDPASVPSIVEYGVEFVPFTSVRISPELAALRRRLNAETTVQTAHTWTEKACTPGLHVTYRRADSMGVRALGRL